MKKFHLQIAAPDGLRYDGDAVQISVRGIEGELAVLAGHIPFVTALKAGECRVYIGENGETIRVHLSLNDGTSLLLTDYASCGKKWNDENCMMTVWFNLE